MAMKPNSKPRKCKAPGCNNKFTPFNTLERWCSPKCGAEIAFARMEKIKSEKIKKVCQPYTKRRGKPNNSIGHQLGLTQKVFNTWIRWRDRHRPCVSSGATKAQQWDAGHYIAVGSAKGGSLLRFDEDNVHKQTSEQNQHKGGAMTEYRPELIRRVGIETVERLESTYGVKKWTIEEVRAIRAKYRKRLRDEQQEIDTET